MAVTQYIGARYIPVFADPAEWSSAKQYEPLTVVLHEGNSYTSRQFVPIGVDIDNTDFWAETGNYNAQVEAYRQEVLRFSDYFHEKAFAFDTVDAMQESDSLYVGAICHTNGFHSRGDGGAAWYVVSDSGEANGMDVLELQDSLKASLVMEETESPIRFGMEQGDEIDYFLSRCSNYGVGIIDLGNNSYSVRNTVQFDAPTIVKDGTLVMITPDATMLRFASNDCALMNITAHVRDRQTTRLNHYLIVFSTLDANNIIDNVSLIGCEVYNTSNFGVYFCGCKHVEISNCFIHDTMGDGIHFNNSSFISISDCQITNTGDDCIGLIGYCYQSNVDNNFKNGLVEHVTITNCTLTAGGARCIAAQGCADVMIENCTINKGPRGGIIIGKAMSNNYRTFSPYGSVVVNKCEFIYHTTTNYGHIEINNAKELIEEYPQEAPSSRITIYVTNCSFANGRAISGLFADRLIARNNVSEDALLNPVGIKPSDYVMSEHITLEGNVTHAYLFFYASMSSDFFALAKSVIISDNYSGSRGGIGTNRCPIIAENAIVTNNMMVENVETNPRMKLYTVNALRKVVSNVEE